MKKALTKVLLTAITLVIFAAIVPLSASASTSNNKTEVYKQLTTKLNLNSAAACGIMANIERESDFNPRLVVNDSNGRQSGGLCQWNGGRFANLKNYCSKNGYDYLSIDGQIAYLLHELKSSSYGYIYDYLKGVSNNADGAYDAAWYWCYYFEIPSNRSQKADERGYNAERYYWPVYGQIDIKAPSLSLTNKRNPYDIDHTISFKWSDGGDDVTHYYLYVAAKNTNGQYDWNKAKVAKLNSGTTGKNVAGTVFNKGDYAAYVKAYNSDTGKTVNSNFAQFSVKCLSHKIIDSKVLKPATYESAGSMEILCTQCGAKASRVLPQLTMDDFRKSATTGVRVSAYIENKIKLSWNPLPGADGYLVLQYIDSKWVTLARVEDGTASDFIVSNLKPGTKYIFNVRGFRYNDEGISYVSAVQSPIIGATRPYAPGFGMPVTANRMIRLNWTKRAGVDGYAIYVAIGKGNTTFKHAGNIYGDSSLTHTYKNLKKGETYTFVIRAFIKTTNGYALSPNTITRTVVCK
ncbi:MAG: hypothetical protein IJ349_08000 [Clostridia bacterium]|nr:hypothetical protein [Clostridia bacterium]